MGMTGIPIYNVSSVYNGCDTGMNACLVCMHAWYVCMNSSIRTYLASMQGRVHADISGKARVSVLRLLYYTV